VTNVVSRPRVAGLGVLAVLTIAGALAVRSAPPPAPAPATPGSSSALPGWSANGAPPAPWVDLTWTAGDKAPFDFPGNTYVEDAIPWHRGFVAVGYTVATDGSGGSEAHVWTSPDGGAWTAMPGGWAGVNFHSVMRVGSELAILGALRGPDVGEHAGSVALAMWTSPDATSWTRSALPAALFDGQVVWFAAAVADRLLVDTGNADGTGRWLRRTGGLWERVDPGGAFRDTNLAGITATDDGWLAFGMAGWSGEGGGIGRGDDPSDDRGAIWRSADGEHWTPADVVRPGTAITQLARVANGWVAVGTDHGGCPRCVGHPTLVWRSDDAQHWTPLEMPLARENSFGGTVVAADGGRALAFDTLEDGRLRIRESTDGATWQDVAVRLEPPLGTMDNVPIRLPVLGSGAVITFDHVSLPAGPEHLWVVPYVARPGLRADAGATQAPRPLPGSQDRPCLPAGQECG
jgi:hypothetical protein